MKGIELPTSTLIVIIIAAIVLVAVIGFFIAGWVGTEEMKQQNAWTIGCFSLLWKGCNPEALESISVHYDANGDGRIDSADTMLDLCRRMYGAGMSPEECVGKCLGCFQRTR